MFPELAKSRSVQAALVVLPLAATGLFVLKGFDLRGPSWPFGTVWRAPESSDAIAKMRASLQADRTRLVEYEQKQSQLRAEVIRRRKLFQEGKISEAEVKESEQ